MRWLWLWVSLVLVLSAGAWAAEPAGAMPENLAPRAKVSASSHFDEQYTPQQAASGALPAEYQSPSGDWAVKGTQDGWFELRWDKPVQAAQIVYFARTTSPLLESFKDYAIYADGQDKPIATGRLERRRGPQRIDLPSRQVTRLRIEFLSSWPDSPNPGAAEIAVFPSPLSAAQMAGLLIPPEEKTPAAIALRDNLIEGKFGFREMLLVQRRPLDISHVYVYHVEGWRPGGGLYVYRPGADGGELKCIFDAGKGMITTADLSYDGREVVFAMRSGGHEASNPMGHIEDISRYEDETWNYQIFRINIDGTGLTQLTHGRQNNLDPCWLPDGGVAFISDRKPAYAYCWVTTSPVLYRMERDGSRQVRLSANYLMDFTPSVLNDGRIVYTRWEYVDRPACPIQSLWAINPNGTGLAGYYGNRVLSPGTFMDAQPIPGTPNSVICTATNHNGPCRGAIVAIDPSKGANSPEAVRNLTPEVNIYSHRVGGGPYGNGMLDTGVRGQYEKPYCIDAQTFLVSKGGTVQIRDFDANAASLLHPRGGLGFYSPQPIRKQDPPPPLAPHEARLPPDGSVSGGWASVILRDVYMGLGPTVKRGEIKQIAVVQEVEKSTHSPFVNKRPDGPGNRAVPCFGFQFPLVSCGATYAPKKVWGFADVAPDGSAAFRVPSEVPIYFLALDGEGRAVQRMRTFTHLMPDEVQVCVGCHADRGMVLPGTTSFRHQSLQPQELRPPAWGVKGFSYQEVVQDVLDRHCVKCHNERTHPKGVDLSGDMTDFFCVSYDVLCRTGTQAQDRWRHNGSPSGTPYDKARGQSPWVEWIWTINGSEMNILEIAPRRWGSPASKLARIVAGDHKDADGKPRANVPDEDRRRVYLWMDLNIPYYGTSSSNHKAALGSRRMMPAELDAVLQDVSARRCGECHKGGIPRTFYTRITNPQHNAFLLAPLAKQAGGTQQCGRAVFANTEDPDYQKILRTFQPIHDLLGKRPRADMPGFTVMCDTP